MVAVLIKEDGTEEIIKKSSIDSTGMNIPLNGTANIKIKDNSKGFVDINEHWSKNVVDFVSARELFDGVSEDTFSPDSKMTHGMLVSVLYRLEGIPDNNVNGKAFNDVNTNKYYSNAIAWASSNSIVNGISDKEFDPESSITREQLAQIIYKYEKYSNNDIDTSNSKNIEEFSDSEEVSNWAKEAMNYTINSGLISGKGNNNLDPKGTATRAEVATIFYRLINK